MGTRAAGWARAVCAAALCVVVSACGAVRSDGTDGAAPAEAGEPGGAGKLPPSELQGRWWEWAAGEARGSNPVEDRDGGYCGVGQPADVWFLAGTFGGHAVRFCPLPGGLPVAFPLVNTFGTDARCEDFMASARGTARLDGEAVEPDRSSGVGISFRAAERNPVTGEGGTFRTTGCGLWVQLPPLEPGTHMLEIQGSSGDFTTSVEYELSVGDDPGPSS